MFQEQLEKENNLLIILVFFCLSSGFFSSVVTRYCIRRVVSCRFKTLVKVSKLLSHFK